MSRLAGTLQVFPTPADVAKALADNVVAAARAAIAARGRFTVALSGGTTPKATYTLLSQAPYANALDWTKVIFFFGDERCVPPSNDQSNFKTAYDTFIRALNIPREHVHRMHGEEDPQFAAASYRTELTTTLGSPPVLDLVMLGMGPDGHTASLFPGNDPLANEDDLVRAVYSQSQQQWRITLTPKVINAARAVVFAVEGAAKAKTLADVREGPYNPTTYPSQIIAPTSGSLTWLVDKAAAGQ